MCSAQTRCNSHSVLSTFLLANIRGFYPAVARLIFESHTRGARARNESSTRAEGERSDPAGSTFPRAFPTRACVTQI